MTTDNVPPPRKSSLKGAFRFLNAIMTGVTLGFIAVIVLPYALPSLHPDRTPPLPSVGDAGREQTAAVMPRGSANTSGIPASSVEDIPAPELKPTEDAAEKPASEMTSRLVPAAPPVTGPAAKATEDPVAEPVLVPAVQLTFPKPFASADMDANLSPVTSFKLGDEDLAALKEVLALIQKGQGEAARSALAKLRDRTARKFAEWRVLQVSGTSFRDLLAFSIANPTFPVPTLDPGQEKSIAGENTPDDQVLKFFANRKPLTGAGKASLGKALIATGDETRGVRLIRQAWLRHDLDLTAEKGFTSRFARFLNPGDEDRRKQWLLLREKSRTSQKTADSDGSPGRASRLSALKVLARLRAAHGKGKPIHGSSSEVQDSKSVRLAKLKARSGRGQKGKSSRPESRGRKGRHRSAGNTDSDAKGGLNAAAWKRLALPGNLPIRNVALKRAVVKAQQEDVKAPEASPPEATKEAGKPADIKAAPDKDRTKQPTAQQKAAQKAFKLAKEAAGSPEVLFLRVKALRNQNGGRKAWSLLRSLKPEAADLAAPDKWWELRRAEARRALSAGRPQTAYGLAKRHGPLDDDGEADAEFFAGWIAFKFRNDAALAKPHFQAAKAARGSIRDEARAGYWLGRASMQLGLKGEAESAFRDAAASAFTFYGALSRQMLNGAAACDFRAPPVPSKDDIAAFLEDDAVKALAIAGQLELKSMMVSYFLDLARQVNDKNRMVLLLELAERISPPHVAIRAAKIAINRGFPVEAYAFPALLPKFEKAGGNTSIEPALLNALTRQESEFHTGSVSGAGARGLMQLLPGTARLVAVANKMKFEQDRLISDPSYNVTLGSAFLASLLSGFDGSYILSLAAYNAGPGRVAGWIKELGDPRKKTIDPVDWIERIPFTETHGYVQRILESTQMYRCRLQEGKGSLQIAEDLHRGRPGKLPRTLPFTGQIEVEPAP